MEWGQQFMATLEFLKMLGAFLLVFTPNKKQFPLFKGLLLSGLEDEWLGGFAGVGGWRWKGHHVFRLKTRAQTA